MLSSAQRRRGNDKLASENYDDIEVKDEVRLYTSKSNLLRYLIFISNSYEAEDCPAMPHHVQNILMMTFLASSSSCSLVLLCSCSMIKSYKRVDKLDN